MRTYEMTDDRSEFDRYQAHFSIGGLLDLYREETEKAMRQLGEPDFEIYRPHLIDAYFPYSTRTDEQKANHNIALFAIAQNEDNYQYVPEMLRTSEFVNMAFKLNPKVVKYISPDQRTYDHIKMVAKYKPELLEDMGIDYSKHIALTAVSVNPSIYLELNDDWQQNSDIMSVAINKSEGSNIKEIFYAKNREFIKDILKLDIKEMPPLESPEKENRRYTGPALKMESSHKKDKK